MSRADVERICLDAADRHGCHTVILYGSWARGDATGESDIDVLCIRDDGPSFRDSRLVDGIYLDAFVYPVTAFASIDPALLRILGGAVLRERDGLGDQLLGRVNDLFARGPDPIADDDRHARIVWAHRCLDRIRGADEAEADYRRMYLLVQALDDWFTLRGRWFPGSKEGFAWLRRHDPAAYERFAAAFRPNASHEAIAALVRAVYGAIGG
jgi:predicted nucleotidyltransferase